MVGAGLSVDSSDLPDLVPLLPTNHSNVNDRWVDTVYASGKTLYRFDTVIFNQGAGAFEVIRDNASSPTSQYVWENKVPPAPVTVDDPPPTTVPGQGERRQIDVAGGPKGILYSPLIGHNHFHTQLIAGYELRVNGGGALVSTAAKNNAGFCLYDSWGAVNYYDASLCRPTQISWTGAIRMGISPDRGDFYGSQLGDQWIDVTDVTPGTYALRAEVNPARIYHESDTSNNAISENGVVIPGAIANAASAATPVGTAVNIPLTGTLVGASVKSRKPTCTEDQTSEPTCMQTATAGQLTFQASGSPSAGSVQFTDATADLAAVARFTPPAGFTGTATFAYTTTDSRGLRSKPATVTVTVGSTTTTPPPPGGGGTTGTGKATVKLAPTFRLVRTGGATFLKMTGTLPRTQAGRLVRVQRKANGRITIIGSVRVAKNGRFSRMIRVRTATVSVRASLGSSATTKAATSPFRRIS